MRTCPACGEDTKAETTEPCTECGFSPVSPDDGPAWEDSAWAAAPEAPAPKTSVEPAAEPTFSTEPTAEPSPAPEPQPTPVYGLPDEPEAPKPPPGRGRIGLGWVVIVLIGLAWQGFNLFDGCGEVFNSEPGPTAEETESALESDAAFQGLTASTANCPDSAEDTEVGSSFDCEITTASGNSGTVTVTNREEQFEWPRGPFVELLRQEQGS